MKNEKHKYITMGSLNITIRKIDGFVNASKYDKDFSKDNDTPTELQLERFLASQDTYWFINSIMENENRTFQEVVEYGEDGIIWVHPLLFLDFAGILNSQFKYYVLLGYFNAANGINIDADINEKIEEIEDEDKIWFEENMLEDEDIKMIFSLEEIYDTMIEEGSFTTDFTYDNFITMLREDGIIDENNDPTDLAFERGLVKNHFSLRNFYENFSISNAITGLPITFDEFSLKLIEDGYVDNNLQPTEKAIEERFFDLDTFLDGDDEFDDED